MVGTWTLRGTLGHVTILSMLHYVRCDDRPASLDLDYPHHSPTLKTLVRCCLSHTGSQDPGTVSVHLAALLNGMPGLGVGSEVPACGVVVVAVRVPVAAAVVQVETPLPIGFFSSV